MHPAFKEWIQSRPEQLYQEFNRLAVGVIADRQPYEARPPLVRLGLSRSGVSIALNDGRLSAQKGAASDPLKFLFVALCAYRDLKQKHINFSELKEVWAKLGSLEAVKTAVNIRLPREEFAVATKFRDWQKKINKDRDINRLIVSLTGGQETSDPKERAREPLISVSARNAVGAQIEVSFPHLPLEELDWDDALHSAFGAATK